MISRTHTNLFGGMIGAGLVALLAVGLNIGTAAAGPVASNGNGGGALPPPQPTGTTIHPGPIYRLQGETEYAYAGQYSNGVAVNIQVGRSTSNNSTTSYLNLFTYDSNTGSYDCAYGSIPAGALGGSANGNLTLDLDTATAPGLYTCSGNGGQIHLAFHKSNAFSHRGVRNDTSQYGSISLHQMNNYEETSASVEGTVFGLPMPAGAGATMGHGHSHSIEIQQGR